MNFAFVLWTEFVPRLAKVCWWNYCWNLKILEFGILNIVYSSVFIRYSHMSFNPRLWWPNPFSSFTYLNIWFITVNRERFTELNFVFSRLSVVPRKFFHEYKHLSLIVLNKEHLWPRQRKSISVKTSMALKPWIFSPANLYPAMICPHLILSVHKVPWIHMIYNVHIWYQFNFAKTQPWQIHLLLYNEKFQAGRDLAKLDTFYNSIKLIQGIIYLLYSLTSQLICFLLCTLVFDIYIIIVFISLGKLI